MRDEAKGVKTAVYKKRGNLNMSQTVLTTMATVAQWREEEQRFYTGKPDAFQLLKEQRLFSSILLAKFHEIFRDYKRKGLIEKVNARLYRWLVDPRQYSALEQDREAYRKEQEECK